MTYPLGPWIDRQDMQTGRTCPESPTAVGVCVFDGEPPRCHRCGRAPMTEAQPSAIVSASSGRERLELFIAMLLDEFEVSAPRLARAVESIAEMESHRREDRLFVFRTWHHAGYRAFVAELAGSILDGPTPEPPVDEPR